MTTSLPLDAADAVLVERSLAGDREAFGRIVARYQSIVCALAYSATGSRCHSEDLAQETFVTAWRSLRQLREPGRLRAWLCGIARHVIHADLRRLGRQPAHAAQALDEAHAVPAVDPLPPAHAVTNEEMALLWREVGRLPEIYREPLILYYRDQRSVTHVAEALRLTPDAVMQRLTRGRRQLQERMAAFIETTLERTNPGPQFTLQVTAALPLLAGAGPVIAASSVPGGAVKGGVFALLLAWAAPLVGVFAAIGISWSDLRHARTPQERRFVGRYLLALWAVVAAFVVAMPLAGALIRRTGLDRRDDWVATAPFVAVWFTMAMVALTLIVGLLRGRAALRRTSVAALATAAGSRAQPASPLRRILELAGVLVSLFWILMFLAWRTGDQRVAVAIGLGLLLLGLVPLVDAWLRPELIAREQAGGRYLALCGLTFLAILNWRLDVWLAPIYGVDLATMRKLLPMSVVHGLSLVAIAWTSLLVFVTRPADPA